MMRPNKWEVWYAKVAYEDNPEEIKERPVLVMENGACYIFSFKITSHEPRLNFFGEYRLVKWREAGLHKPSTVRTSKRLRLIESDFVHKIGRLHPIDIIGVMNLLL